MVFVILEHTVCFLCYVSENTVPFPIESCTFTPQNGGKSCPGRDVKSFIATSPATVCVYYCCSTLYYLFPSNDPPLLAPSGPPTSLLAKTGARNLTLSWSPPAPSDRNEAIASYKVDCTSSGVPSSSGETAELSLVVSSLVPFTVYNCCVLASNAVGTGPSSCQLFRTKEAGE